MQAAGLGIAADRLAERLDALLHSTKSSALIAVEGGTPSGLVARSWYRTLSEDLTVAQIDMLLVAPDARRRMLLKAASQAARTAGCGSILLAASAGEESLRAFCTATGFEEAGVVHVRPLRKKS